MIGLERGIEILELFAREKRPLSFGQVQQLYNDLPAPTLSRILKTLVAEGVIDKTGRQGPYEVGDRLLALAEQLIQPLKKESVIKAGLTALSAATGETSAYFERKQDSVELIEKCEVEESFHLMSKGGQNDRIFRNGFGQMMLAHCEDSEINDLYSRLPEGPILPLSGFKERLKLSREESVLVECGEAKASAMRIVAPVLGEAGILIGVIGIATFLMDGDVSNLIQAVKRHAENLSEQLRIF